MLTNLKKTAFSLLEVLLASIIFIISIGSFYYTLSAVRQPVLQKERALTAALYGRQLLESLRSQVNADDIVSGVWSIGNLALGNYSLPPYTDPQGVVYNASYTVTCADGTTTATPNPPGDCDQTGTGRAVNLNITFPDTQ